MKSISIKTLTPLWTGDMDKKSKRISVNGLLGSIRWWAEAINRGSGNESCDPTSDNRCPRKYNNIDEYCPSCYVFGATGWRKLFKIQCGGGESLFERTFNIRPVCRNRGWYYPGSGIIGNIQLNIIYFNSKFKDAYILLPLIIASRWGAIGAKTQLGYGVFEIDNIPKINVDDYFNLDFTGTNFSPLKIRKNIPNQGQYPSLKDMFFTKIQFKATSHDWWKEINGVKRWNKNCGSKGKPFPGLIENADFKYWIQKDMVPIAPAIKDWLRYREGKSVWNSSNNYQNQRFENYVFGTIKEICAICYTKLKTDKRNHRQYWCPNCRESFDKKKIFERNASKINISFAYKIEGSIWEFRLWGSIPQANSILNIKDRNRFLNNLKGCLQGEKSAMPYSTLFGSKVEDPHLVVWREYNSSRDTIRKINNYHDYLQSLTEDRDVD